MSEYQIATVDCVGDARSEYVEEGGAHDAIERGKRALGEEHAWQRLTATKTTRVMVIVLSIDEEGVTDNVCDGSHYVHPRAPKCHGADHMWSRQTDGNTVTDACARCGATRDIELCNEDSHGVRVQYRDAF